jgi:hypothetical protein
MKVYFILLLSILAILLVVLTRRTEAFTNLTFSSTGFAPLILNDSTSTFDAITFVDSYLGIIRSLQQKLNALPAFDPDLTEDQLTGMGIPYSIDSNNVITRTRPLSEAVSLLLIELASVWENARVSGVQGLPGGWDSNSGKTIKQLVDELPTKEVMTPGQREQRWQQMKQFFNVQLADQIAKLKRIEALLDLQVPPPPPPPPPKPLDERTLKAAVAICKNTDENLLDSETLQQLEKKVSEKATEEQQSAIIKRQLESVMPLVSEQKQKELLEVFQKPSTKAATPEPSKAPEAAKAPEVAKAAGAVSDVYAPMGCPSISQGQEYQATLPFDMSQYIRKDSIPCWACSLP